MRSSKRLIWWGRVRFSGAATEGTEIVRNILVSKLSERAMRVIISRVGEGELELSPDDTFNNAPFAIAAQDRHTQLHRVNGSIERVGDEIKGRFFASRGGENTVTGTFELKHRTN